MNELLRVRDLSVTFSMYNGEIKAVRGVSFDVYEGETLAIVGESGCGKSVTAKAIARLLEGTSAVLSPESSVEFEGRNLLALSKRELNEVRGGSIGMVFQNAASALDPTMTIGRALTEKVILHGRQKRTDAGRRAEELLRMVELPDPKTLLSRYPHELSGGQRQRVMIAMALSCEPRLLIADEPTTALDVTVQAQILSLLQRLKERLNMSVLLITHDLGVVAGAAKRVHVMYAGQIVERGSTAELFSHPRHPYTAALLEAIPHRAMQRRGALFALPGSPPDLRLALPCCPFSARCRYAMPVCKKMPPAEADGVACWLTDPRAPRIELRGAGDG